MKDLKVLPNATDIESNLLGIMFFDQNAPAMIIPELKATDFYKPMHERIYSAAIAVFKRGDAVDTMTVAEYIHSKKIDVEMYELTKLSMQVTNFNIDVSSLDAYIRIIKEKAQLRQVIRITHEYNNLAYNSDNAKELLNSLISSIGAVLSLSNGKSIETFTDVIFKALNAIQEAGQRTDHLLGIASSIKAVSKLTLGYAAPDLTILAAGTSEGKSTFMLNEAKAAALQGKKVLIFSLEMSNIQLMYKIFCSETDIDMDKLRTGQLSDIEYKKLMEVISNRLEALNIFLYDIGGLSIVEFQSIVKTVKAKHGLDIVFVDYLQLMTTDGCEQKFGNREGQVSYISRQLKATCKNEAIPIVALSQLKRIMEKRMYIKSDLRETGAIEQDADRILFIYRPKYHKIDTDENGNAYTEEDAFIQVEKERLGQTGVLPVRFNGRYSRFEDKEQYTPINEINF